ncbi:MAG: HNH endonuclease [Saprospiraceae bacterium]
MRNKYFLFFILLLIASTTGFGCQSNITGKLPDGSDGFIKKLDALEAEGIFDDFFDDLSGVEDMEKWAETFGRSADNLDMWKALKDRPHWVRMNADLHMKMNEFPLPNGSITTKSELVDKVNDLYDPQKFQKPANPFTPPGTYNGIEYNSFGFADFNEFYPNHLNGDFKYKPTEGLNKTSPGSDFTKATKELKDRFENSEITSNPFKIDGVDYTWHHLEDGKTLVPVEKAIHKNINIPHTGGWAIIQRSLQGFFN